MMLEGMQWKENAFMTLTYADEHLPVLANGRPTLVRKDASDFLKRLRFKIEPWRIRTFTCGEYGDLNQRPHYHFILFNHPTCLRGQTKKNPKDGSPLWRECCDVCRQMGETWGGGNVDLGEFTVDSAQYCAGYTLKKLNASQTAELDGREPEYGQPSLKPGLGYSAMWEVADQIMKLDLVDAEGDVPSALRFGSRIMPIGRYLRQALRQMIGHDKKAPQCTLDEMAKEVRDLFERVETSAPSLSFAMKQLTVKNGLIEAGDQAVLNMEARAKIFSYGKKRDVR